MPATAPFRPPFRLAPLAPQHRAAAQGLSAGEGWPHRPEDWALLLELGQGIGAFAGETLVGTALFTPYGEGAGTCSMILVDPAARRNGLGRQLMQSVLGLAGPDRSCRLIATEAGRPLYEALGFTATGEIGQFQGIAQPTGPTQGAVRAGLADLDALAALDRRATGMDRQGLLHRLVDLGEILIPPASATAQTDPTNGNTPPAWIGLRRFGRGLLLGPLVATPDARGEAAALGLLQAGLAATADHFTRIDLAPAALACPPILSLLQAAGLQRVASGLAMTRPADSRHSAALPAPTPPARLLALASQALG